MKRALAVLALSTLLISACAEDRATTDKVGVADKGGADGKKPVVVLDTSMGKIKIELYPDKAPITVKNFLQYVDDKFYDDTVFHRVIKDFMIQGGGFETGMQNAKTPAEFQAKEKKKTRDPIKNEAKNGLSNTRGTIAMARTNDPDSATAQFFINVKDNSEGLDPNPDTNPDGYCVFGKVIEGMDVVDKIRAVRTHDIIPRRLGDIPDEDVVIKSVRRVKE